MKLISRNITPALFTMFAIGLFTTRFFLYAPKTLADNTTSTASVAAETNVAPDFEQDVKEGQQEIEHDQQARQEQQDIDNEDNQEAGADEQNHTIVVDGEEPQIDIEHDLELEVNIETESDHHDEELNPQENNSSTGESGSEIDEGGQSGNEDNINASSSDGQSSDTQNNFGVEINDL